MAVDMYLVIPPATGNPPISGDPVTDQYFKGASPSATVVEIRQFSVGSENRTSVGSATTARALEGDTEGVAHREVGGHDVSLSVRVECHGRASGQNAVIPAQTWRRRRQAIPGLRFQYGLLSKIDWSAGSDDEQPIERLTFAYGALGIGYYPQKPDGHSARL